MGYFSISASSGAPASSSDGAPKCPFASLSLGSSTDRRAPPEQLRLTILGHVTNDINIFVGKETRAQGTGDPVTTPSMGGGTTDRDALRDRWWSAVQRCGCLQLGHER